MVVIGGVLCLLLCIVFGTLALFLIVGGIVEAVRPSGMPAGAEASAMVFVILLLLLAGMSLAGANSLLGWEMKFFEGNPPKSVRTPPEDLRDADVVP